MTLYGVFTSVVCGASVTNTAGKYLGVIVEDWRNTHSLRGRVNNICTIFIAGLHPRKYFLPRKAYSSLISFSLFEMFFSSSCPSCSAVPEAVEVQVSPRCSVVVRSALFLQVLMILTDSELPLQLHASRLSSGGGSADLYPCQA